MTSFIVILQIYFYVIAMVAVCQPIGLLNDYLIWV